METGRFTAKNVWIGDLLRGTYVRHDDKPNYVLLDDGSKIMRVMILGTVVSSEDEFVVDDGSGLVVVRSFDNALPSLAPGTFVRVMGRPRDFGNQIYVAGEFVKQVSQRWLDVRKKTMPHMETFVEAKVEKQDSKTDGVIDLVRKLDEGDGADYNEVVTSLGARGEDTIVHLLAVGELFETRPGKLKILE